LSPALNIATLTDHNEILGWVTSTHKIQTIDVRDYVRCNLRKVKMWDRCRTNMRISLMSKKIEYSGLSDNELLDTYLELLSNSFYDLSDYDLLICGRLLGGIRYKKLMDIFLRSRVFIS